jgi:hypothetical protein
VRPVRLESGETRCLGGNLPPQLRSLNVARDMCINLVLLLPDTDSGATGSLEIQNHSGVLLEPPMNVLVGSRRRLALTEPGKSSP